MLDRMVPWMTDPAVRFMQGYFAEGAVGGTAPSDVLEFGCGASTLFFTSRARTVTSIEHDISWLTSMREILSKFHMTGWEGFQLDLPYASQLEFLNGRSYDLIAIDGRDRVECLKHVMNYKLLKDDGVLVLDNTERIMGYGARYREMLDYLHDYHLIHFEQKGEDLTGWKSPCRWITTVALSRKGVARTTLGAML